MISILKNALLLTNLCWIKLAIYQTYASNYSSDAGFFTGDWTNNDWKFLLIEITSVSVAVISLWNDDNRKSPKGTEVILTFILSSVLVFFAYEYSIQNDVGTTIAMILSFGIGTFSLHIYNSIKAKVPEIINSLINVFQKKQQ